MEGNPLVSVIIPTNNRNKKLANCLKSVFNSSYRNFEVIVVNDAPGNDVKAALNGFHARLLQNKTNMLPAHCRNKGASVAKGKLLFFVDDDNVVDKECISKLVDAYKTHTGLIGPIMYDEHGTVWFSGARSNWINPNPKKVDISETKKQLIETDVIPNAYLISKQKYDAAGGENGVDFPTQHEELDLAKRLSIKGYKHYICTAASVIHDYKRVSDHVTNKQIYYIAKNNIVIEKKYAPFGKRLVFYFLYLPAQFAFYLAVSIKIKKLGFFGSYIKGLKDGLLAKVE